jgi:hypothetical protein
MYLLRPVKKCSILLERSYPIGFKGKITPTEAQAQASACADISW